MNMYLGGDRQHDAMQMVTSGGVIMKSLMRIECGRPQNLHEQFSLL
jgi:hypothetical protein